ncbi:MAG: 5'-nucleotidase C-terminal domain-containing protein [Longimicrobiales bacterium]
MKSTTELWLTLALATSALGCASGTSAGAPPVDARPGAAPEAGGVGEPSASYEVVGESAAGATDLDALIDPFRAQMQEQLSEVLGQAAGAFVKADPEGTLDNLVADALLDEVQEWARAPVDIVLLNDGGLRVPIPAGPIQVRIAYELLPFENYITVLTLSGAQVESLADQVAQTGGEPIAGWTMVLREGDATSVQVAGESVDPDAQYRLATVDYLADGGGSWSVLWEPMAREDLPMLIRDIFVAYVREEGEVRPALDGRIVEGEGPGRDGQLPGGGR